MSEKKENATVSRHQQQQKSHNIIIYIFRTLHCSDQKDCNLWPKQNEIQNQPASQPTIHLTLWAMWAWVCACGSPEVYGDRAQSKINATHSRPSVRSSRYAVLHSSNTNTLSYYYCCLNARKQYILDNARYIFCCCFYGSFISRPFEAVWL